MYLNQHAIDSVVFILNYFLIDRNELGRNRKGKDDEVHLLTTISFAFDILTALKVGFLRRP